MSAHDDDQSKHKISPPKDLEILSIDALEEYISSLEAEIERAKATVAAKRAHRGGADRLFRQ